MGKTDIETGSEPWTTGKMYDLEKFKVGRRISVLYFLHRVDNELHKL